MPVWIRICLFKFPCLLNILPHPFNSHLKIMTYLRVSLLNSLLILQYYFGIPNELILIFCIFNLFKLFSRPESFLHYNYWSIPTCFPKYFLKLNLGTHSSLQFILARHFLSKSSYCSLLHLCSIYKKNIGSD